MILLLAVAAGLVAGLVRAKIKNRHLQPPELDLVWLVPVAFVPQWLAFHLPATQRLVADSAAAAILVTSQALLLIFAWYNRKQPGFGSMGTGLALNLMVIILNGGFMPVSPEVVTELLPDNSPETWQVGERIGWNIVLPASATRLWWLTDRLLMPAWFPYRRALSIGDVLIAIGAFWLLWSSGESKRGREKGV